MTTSNFNFIPTPLPPMLAKMAGVLGDSRYFAICYYGSKATWTDGRQLATFSFYGVYEPLINHLALEIYLWDYHLGSDEEYPTYQLLCDRVEGKMYVGKYKEVETFLDSQHPPLQTMQLSEHEWGRAKAQIDAEMQERIEEDYQRQGMFEIFGRISPKQHQERIQLVQWLDRQVTEELLRRYLDEANVGNYNAIFALERLKARIRAASSEN